MSLDPAVAERLKRTADGLVPAIVQQHGTGEVLMLGWMDDEALARTLTTGRATYWSRSRQEYWVKGETSGHRQWVREVRLDCDGDALLVQVDQEGPACHTGDAQLLRRRRAARGAARSTVAEPDPRRRSFGPAVGAGVAAAALAAVAGHQPWASGTASGGFGELSATVEAGRVPAANALALVVLACWGVLLVTRGRVRRVRRRARSPGRPRAGGDVRGRLRHRPRRTSGTPTTSSASATPT